MVLQQPNLGLLQTTMTSRQRVNSRPDSRALEKRPASDRSYAIAKNGSGFGSFARFFSSMMLLSSKRCPDPTLPV